MRNDLLYLLDNGQYYEGDSRAMEQLSLGENRDICRVAEQYYTYNGGSRHGLSFWEEKDTPAPLFWNFPHGRGSKQPWRRKLWEHQNRS